MLSANQHTPLKFVPGGPPSSNGLEMKFKEEKKEKKNPIIRRPCIAVRIKKREFGETKEKDRVLTKQTKQVFVFHYLAIFSL
jgi:arginyl-tRNA--protein-N-Asp/Glu arginylyltransferase